MNVTINLSYHPNQKKIFDNDIRFKVACCGRRFGKTMGSQNWLFEHAIEDKDGQESWWIEPVFSQSKMVFKQFKNAFQHVIKYKNESELLIELLNGAMIYFKSADNPDNLRGAGLKRAVMDECATMKSETWTEAIRPALMDHKGEAVFIGTPKGMNWFAEMYNQGMDALAKDIVSFRYTSYDNPLIDRVEIDRAKAEMPERLFRQEILAEFIDDIGGVFRNVRDCVKGQLEEPQIGEEYLMGVDLAKYQDFTVICIVKRSNGHLVAFDRFNQINWSLQEQRILNLANKYKPSIWIDQGQVGDAILEDLNRKYGNIRGIKFTNENKTDMVNYLSNKIEKHDISYPEIPELINELRIYEYEALPSGRLRMNAPSGKHDDCVIALGLAVWQLQDSYVWDNNDSIITETRKIF